MNDIEVVSQAATAKVAESVRALREEINKAEMVADSIRTMLATVNRVAADAINRSEALRRASLETLEITLQKLNQASAVMQRANEDALKGWSGVFRQMLVGSPQNEAALAMLAEKLTGTQAGPAIPAAPERPAADIAELKITETRTVELVEPFPADETPEVVAENRGTMPEEVAAPPFRETTESRLEYLARMYAENKAKRGEAPKPEEEEEE
jgi:hypothetical protein